MTDAAFVDLMKTMRAAQNAYFKNPTAANLANARQIERAADHAIDQRADPQPNLFDPEPPDDTERRPRR